jgi:dTDP-4-dehydrorhamnose reductase|tara:strand:+ start:313 stop:1209 length:897 start_codon:yes stop_codon:yes gene_type:complete
LKILILGGSGLLGKKLVEKASDSFEVISTFNNHKIEHSKSRTIRIKLPDEIFNLKSLIFNEKPNLIINTIANTNIDYCEQHKTETYLLHVEMNKQIFKLCEDIASKFIFISSDYVFDGKKGDYMEYDKTSPVNYYGETKAIAESIILQNPTNTVLRSSLIYDWDPQVRFLNYVVDKLRKNENIQAYDDFLTAPIFLEDLVGSIIKAVKKDASGIYNLAGPSCVTRMDFALAIARKFNFDKNLIEPVSVKSLDLIAERPRNSSLNKTKAEKDLDIKFRSIEEGINEVYKKYKIENPTKH